MTKIAIIILNWKNAKLSINLINQLKTIKSKAIFSHIILIDNKSPDNSYKTFLHLFENDPYITVLQTSQNLGFSGGVNYGLEHAIQKRYEYGLVLNNDVDVKKDFLTELLKPFFKINNLAIAGPKIYFKKGNEYHLSKYRRDQLGKVIWSSGGSIDWKNIYSQNRGINEVDTGQFSRIDTDIDFVSGCCMLIKLSTLKKIGLFDDNFFMYLEDVDLCTRFKKANYKIAYVPKSIIYHYNAGSSQAGGDLQQYYLSRNRLLFGFKYSNVKTKLALLRQSFAVLLFSKYKWQKRGTIDFYLRRLNKGSWYTQ